MDPGTGTQPGHDSGSIADEATIASQYARCESSFDRLSQYLTTSIDQTITQRLLDEFGRFRVWAGTAGVHQTGRVSLDYHLRGASHIHAELTELLGDLNKDLEEALKLVEFHEGSHSPHSQVSLGEEFMAELCPPWDQEAEPSEVEDLVSDITHIISCLYKFSTVIRNHVPKECFHKVALIDVPFYQNWDINHVKEMFCDVDSQDNFRVATYLIKRLGKANTRRRQLLKNYEAYHKNIPRHIDNPSTIAGNELINASKPVEAGSARAPAISATVYTTTKSPITEWVQRSQGVEPFAIVKVGDTGNPRGDLPLSIDSSTMDFGNTKDTGPALTPELPGSPLQVEHQPRSQSGVGQRRIERDDDGGWHGLSPEMRGEEYLPMSLKEMEQSIKTHETNPEVEAWLKRAPEISYQGPTVPELEGQSKTDQSWFKRIPKFNPQKRDHQGLAVPKREEQSKTDEAWLKRIPEFNPQKMDYGLIVPKKDRYSRSISDFRFEPSGEARLKNIPEYNPQKMDYHYHTVPKKDFQFEPLDETQLKSMLESNPQEMDYEGLTVLKKGRESKSVTEFEFESFVEAQPKGIPEFNPQKMDYGLIVPKKDRYSKSISDFRFEPSGEASLKNIPEYNPQKMDYHYHTVPKKDFGLESLDEVQLKSTLESNPQEMDYQGLTVLKKDRESKSVTEFELESFVEVQPKGISEFNPQKMDYQGLTVPKKDRQSKILSDFRFEPLDVCQPQPRFIEGVDMAEVMDLGDTVSPAPYSPSYSPWEEGSLHHNTTSCSPKKTSFTPPRPSLRPKPWGNYPTFGPISLEPAARDIHQFNENAGSTETARLVTTFGSATMNDPTPEGVEYLPLNRKKMKQLMRIRRKDLEVAAWLKESPLLDYLGHTVPTMFENSGATTHLGRDKDKGEAATSQTRVPSPPNASFEGKPFECSYCFNIIKVRDRPDWEYVGIYARSSMVPYTEHLLRGHVFEDLQPYVCTALDCPKADELYSSRLEWFNHEVQLHRREWYCDACSKPFSRKTNFQKHIKGRHSEVAEEYFEAVINRCERAITTDIVCPLCGTKYSLQALEEHLGLHLQEVALFALSHPGEASSESSQGSLQPDDSESRSEINRLQGLGDFISTSGF